MLKHAIVGCVLALACGGGVATAARLQGPSGWAWREGTDSGYVGEQAGSNTLYLDAPAGNIDLRASHVRMMSDDGEFVFSHARNAPTASLNGFYLGTSTRTPIQIGDSESTTGLVVAGEAGQKSDLQQWTLSGQTVAAIDGEGRLRLGQVTLDPELVNGRVKLYAVVGSAKELLAQGVPAP